MYYLTGLTHRNVAVCVAEFAPITGLALEAIQFDLPLDLEVNVKVLMDIYITETYALMSSVRLPTKL